ncbi:hypothetical protein [Pseudobacter ginsenosidimutans]|uniref:Uncharacterized protein n=1 Tax=Pseudobacter ginsenosidimutans TaxID=661488 RepID=A0A4Q7N5H4_9BACT|nr:hypothetical protein [Pseudobacter ginsenosidimutans]QEC44823.1 hypothetical protein FSB84_25240 [Pseudobacter ginsenosidimutans]RZS76313.1 hypothetical protein EV199_2194 [Pseudobacter ginsenosidimutans]
MKPIHRLESLPVREGESGQSSATTLPVEEARKILNANGIEYTEEELSIIRGFIHKMAEIAVTQYHRRKAGQAFLIPITQIEHNETKSISICPGEYRRTG